ncbi:MAG: hypothetical protein HOP99_00635 [Dermatophilaceae bacterium]|nr:hypothetical protein [Dermatophilaceae bacterium]NUR81047.1 hypothetical protein [Dermatophilaceae bacterium]
MPLDSTTVIPEGWSRHHAAAARGGMNATVTVGAQTGTTQVDDDVVPTWSSEYDGPARIQAMNDAQQAVQAEQVVHGRAYLVQLDFDAHGITPGMRCHVTAAVNDVDLAGQDLWVIDPQLGSERFTRDLVCSDNQTDAPSAP